MKRAIVSVWDKHGLAELGRGLTEAGYELVSTGGTARRLCEAGLDVVEVSDVTEFPEILDGRVKTLHPALHGGILARREPAHLEELETHDIAPVELVVCNLYPFQATIAQPEATLEDAIEQIDIGGVTLLRAAAKNHAHVAAVSDPADYDAIVQELREEGEVTASTRRRLAIKAFQHTADYDVAIANYLSGTLTAEADRLPRILQLSVEKTEDLRYGENPHQSAATYMPAGPLGGELILGEGLSYNNLLDIDAAWRTASDFAEPTVAIVKHGTPTGVASHPELAIAFENAFATDTVSPFGGIIACNRIMDVDAIEAWGSLLVDAVVAPGFTEPAVEAMAKRKRLRALAITEAGAGMPWEMRGLRGGLLLQERDTLVEDANEWQVVSERTPTEAEWQGLHFAWKVVKHVKSNAIVFGREKQTTGIGAGQMSRVDSVRLAAMKAGDRAEGSVMASDAFFPFPDGVEEAAKAGITAVIEPGGSIRDDQVIEAVNRLGLALVFTGHRHFRH
jgi:phosphoribosylaminoimidazolecarboxamide formyltransferase/IMP cyclohydrolase